MSLGRKATSYPFGPPHCFPASLRQIRFCCATTMAARCGIGTLACDGMVEGD